MADDDAPRTATPLTDADLVKAIRVAGEGMARLLETTLQTLALADRLLVELEARVKDRAKDTPF